MQYISLLKCNKDPNLENIDFPIHKQFFVIVNVQFDKFIQ